MYKFTKHDEPDIDKYEDRLRTNGCICYDYELMESMYLFATAQKDTLASLAKDEMIFKSHGYCTDLSSNNEILNFLMKYEGCPERYFCLKKRDSYSLDQKKVLEKLEGNGYALDFLRSYKAYKSYVSRCGKIGKLLERCTEDAGVNNEGTKIRHIYYNVAQQKNLRYNYNNTDIIGIPKDYNSCITVEDGYFLAWGDFAQSDFRIAYNLFLRSDENDEIMNSCEDKYEALARMVAREEHTEFDLEKFKSERQVYKRMTLATVYGTRDSQIADEQQFIKRMTEFLYKCPRYVEYEQRINDRIDLGLPVNIVGYFGNSEMIMNKYRRADIVNDALNAPVQMGTSEIVILTINAILDEFYKLGYTSDDISVYYVRHDEPVFKIRKNVLKDCWVFKQFETILIDDWSPLRLDFDYGYRYKVSDNDLKKSVSDITLANKDKINLLKPGEFTRESFYPIPATAKLYLDIHHTSDQKSVVTVYSDKYNAVCYYLVNSVDESELINFVKIKLRELSNFLADAEYTGLIVYNKILEDEDYADRMYIRYVVNTLDSARVFTLGELMAYKYSKKNNLENNFYIDWEANKDFVESVKSLPEAIQ